MTREPARARGSSGGDRRAGLRSQLRERRRLVSADEARRSAEEVATTLRQRPWMHPDATVAAFDAIDGELSPAAIRGPWFTGRWCLPRVEGDRLVFVEDDGTGRVHRWGMYEPSGRPLRLDELDVCLVPLVAATPRCDRLGMGGGFYDRTFHRIGGRRGVVRPVLVGVAYDFQVVDFTCRDWDVPLDEVVTPTRVLQRWLRQADDPKVG